MPHFYTKKLVIAGKIVELYEYSKSQVFGLQAFAISRGFNFNGDEQKERSAFSSSRSALHIRALVNSNPDLNKFLTLTFAKNQIDLSESNYEFKKFVQKLIYRYENFKYICVVEFQKRGAVHYHLVCNLCYVKKSIIAEIWEHGFIKINRVQKVKNLGAYFAKHGTKHANSAEGKERAESKKLYGRKKFFCSRGLNRPKIMRLEENTKPFIQKNLSGLKPFFEREFSTDKLTITYKQFKI